MNKSSLSSQIDKFRGKKVVVVGDIMLDHFIYGDVDRISPEAPVPVVAFQKEKFVPGGAANIAANIAALGGVPLMVGMVGHDASGKSVLEKLREMGVDTSYVIKKERVNTIEKIRIVARGQQIVRLDKEAINRPSDKDEAYFINILPQVIKEGDAVVLSDYAKGFITPNIAQSAILCAIKLKKSVLVGTKSKIVDHFKGATLATPNHKEAEVISEVEDMKQAALVIQKKLGSKVLITQGKNGMTLFEDKKELHFPTKAREVVDVVGASDTVSASLATALAAGVPLYDAITIANHAAGIVVGKAGTAVVTVEELKASLA